MQATAVNYGHPSNARKCQRGNLHTLTGMKMCHYFGYLSWRASEFLGIIFWYNLISLAIIQISGY